METYQEFLRDAPIRGNSPEKLTAFSMKTALDTERNKKAEEEGILQMTDEERKQNRALREEIEAADTEEALMKLLRRGVNGTVNREILFRKLLAYEENVMPQVVSRYVSAKRIPFIESAAVLLAFADKKYARALAERYEEIWDPYAKALACVLFGHCQMTETEDLLRSEYERMLKEDPQKNWKDGPLIGLYLLGDGKF